MIIQFQKGEKIFSADLAKPLDISIPLQFNSLENANAWYAPMPEAEPQQFGNFKISVADGAAVNSLGVRLFPHGNGTHTEGVGHISRALISVNSSLKTYHFVAKLVSIFPTKVDDDRVILRHQMGEIFEQNEAEALIIRTLPNDDWKLKMNYSGSNPPYFQAEALEYLAEMGLNHLLTDLPSVDKEDDGGHVLAHKAFWQFGEYLRLDATITEMIFVPKDIKDGLYLLNLQIPSFELDAAPSKPVLYEILG